jgi:hypothetical protein
VNPRQELIEARQQRRGSFGVPAFSFAGVVVVDQGSRQLKVIPPGPSDSERKNGLISPRGHSLKRQAVAASKGIALAPQKQRHSQTSSLDDYPSP